LKGYYKRVEGSQLKRQNWLPVDVRPSVRGAYKGMCDCRIVRVWSTRLPPYLYLLPVTSSCCSTSDPLPPIRSPYPFITLQRPNEWSFVEQDGGTGEQNEVGAFGGDQSQSR